MWQRRSVSLALLSCEEVEATLRKITDGSVNEQTFEELQLPITNIERCIKTFIMGLTSESRIASAAYLSSLYLTLPLVQCALRKKREIKFSSIPNGSRTRTTWNMKVSLRDVLDQTDFEGEGTLPY